MVPCQAGERVNDNAVRKLMQALGLKSLVRVEKDRAYRGQPPAGVQACGVTQGPALENVTKESFFGMFKVGFFRQNRFESVGQLQAGIRQYIRYYNRDSIKQKLKGLSPVLYRAQALGFWLLTVQRPGAVHCRGASRYQARRRISCRASSGSTD
ncbi:integrase core domain-containing protein [Pseudomonas aeruginosa]|nr:integrase core domain-containing protein [Achromobacter xylosoxidans]MBP8322415.1 integrase core domain-containing protein [Pseudomonas aeruginosa]QKI70704.1 IS3 family transposase [Achromobacter xylosoxidans]